MTAKSAAQSAVREAIERAHDQGTRLQPITDEQIEALGEVALWRILVEPYIPPYKGLIETAGIKGVDDAQRVLSRVGRIVQVGEFAYKSKTAAGLDLGTARLRAQVGEFWLFEMYAGQEVDLVSGHKLRLLNETELLMRINEPALIKNYL